MIELKGDTAIKHGALILLVLLSLATHACGQPVYNSKDLAALPCEPASFYFHAVEFDKEGIPIYRDQLEGLETRLKENKLTDVFLFVHGWNKTAAVAEQEYQDFICRFYWHGFKEEGRKRSDTAPGVTNSLMIGVFWPSTLLPNNSDWTAIKFASFYPIRNRADALATVGFQELLETISRGLQANASVNSMNVSNARLHLIGHSFGGRILVRGIDEKLLTKPQVMSELLDKFNLVNLILINAAIPSTAFGDPEQRFANLFMATFNETPEAIAAGDLSRVSKRIAVLSHVKVFNVFSQNDMAGRYLYPFANLFTTEPVVCALGACPAPGYPILQINDGGDLEKSEFDPTFFLNRVVNVDATRVITSHTDVFKGRIASAIWALLLSDFANIEFKIDKIKGPSK